MKKSIKITLSIFSLLIIAFIAFAVYSYNLALEKKIKDGELIRYKGKIYTAEEYSKMFPQVIKVPAKNTPLEAYENFRKAVMSGDIEEAKKYMTEKSIKEDFKDLQDPKMLKKIQGYLPEVKDLKEESTLGNFSSWYYYTSEMSQDKDVPYDLSFEKDKNGYWKISFF